MAEGFARRYGSDVLQAASAGLYPAPIIQLFTKKVMEGKNIKLEGQYPKGLDEVDVSGFDLVVNMSGTKLPAKPPLEVREWTVLDPVGQSEEVYIAVRDQLEMAVMRLILELRRGADSKPQKRTPKGVQPLRRVK
jgi:protein-tyrosine-phosphatase